MAKKPSKKKASSPEWEVAHLQMIFFPIDSPHESDWVKQQHWIRDLTGREPEESFSKAFETTQVVSFGENLTLNLTTDVSRIVFTVYAKPDAGKLVAFSALGKTPKESLDEILGLTSKWNSSTRLPIKRIGLAGRFFRGATSKRSGYATLRKYLPTVKLNPNDIDLLFRINRPRRFKSVPAMQLNRLSSWALMTSVKMAAGVVPGSPLAKTNPVEQYDCTFDFDFNTPAERTEPIPQARVRPIMREMSAAILEVAEKGDVR